MEATSSSSCSRATGMNGSNGSTSTLTHSMTPPAAQGSRVGGAAVDSKSRAAWTVWRVTARRGVAGWSAPRLSAGRRVEAEDRENLALCLNSERGI